MKKNQKKSALSSTLVKTIPLSVAMAILASGNAYAAINAPLIAVDMGDGRGVVKIVTSSLSDPKNKEKVLAELKSKWLEAKPIYLSDDDKHFVDFSKNAKFSKNLTNTLATSESLGDYVDFIDQFWPYN